MNTTPLVLAVSLSAIANATTLPRSDHEMSVGALVRCLGPGDCEIRHVCEYVDDGSPAHDDMAGIPAAAIWRSALVDDAALACRIVTDAGETEVSAVIEHVGGDRELDTIRSLMTRGGTLDWATDLNLPVGNGHRHPAGPGEPCPDAEHLAEGVHKGREVHETGCKVDSVGYVWIQNLSSKYPDLAEGVPEGPATKIGLRPNFYDSPWNARGSTAYWRVECDAAACGIYSAGPPNSSHSGEITWRAP